MAGVRPWLWLPPRLAHDVSPLALGLLSLVTPKVEAHWRSFNWRGLHFPNRLGTAGGLDKGASQICAWWHLGAGFVEVGTVTPEPQGPNPGTIMARDLSNSALWNKMGFPSPGVDKIAQRLRRYKDHQTPIFVNIGKNRITPNERASKDYLLCMERLRPFADAFVVNISSPNTQGLRELLAPDQLSRFLKPLIEAAKKDKAIPLFLKLSPDMSEEQFATALELSCGLGIDGWILTNTSSGLREGLSFPQDGGVSGAPLAASSLKWLRRAQEVLGQDRRDRLLISVGGVMSADQVRERLDEGADLVQVYSALIFSGPWFFAQVAQHERGQA